MKPSADEMRQLIRARPQQPVSFRWSDFRSVRLEVGAAIEQGLLSQTVVIRGYDTRTGCVAVKEVAHGNERRV